MPVPGTSACWANAEPATRRAAAIVIILFIAYTVYTQIYIFNVNSLSDQHLSMVNGLCGPAKCIRLDFGFELLADVVGSGAYEDLDLTRFENPAVCLHVPVGEFAYWELKGYLLGLAGLEGDSIECFKLL